MVSICRHKSWIKKGKQQSTPERSVVLCLRHLSKCTHMEADVMEEGMEVIKDPTAVKYEGRLQHLLVNLFIVQFLWWNRTLELAKLFFLTWNKFRKVFFFFLSTTDLKHVPLCTDNQCMCALASLVGVRDNCHQFWHCKNKWMISCQIVIPYHRLASKENIQLMSGSN